MPAVSKTAPKKSSARTHAKKANQSTIEITIKYSDKSLGQPQLVPIFEEIKKMLKQYEKGTINYLVVPVATWPW